MPAVSSTPINRNCIKYETPKVKDSKRALSTLEEANAKAFSNSERKRTTFLKAEPKYSKRLFEEFFVIGADDEKDEIQKLKGITYVNPKKLYQYPDLPENKNWDNILRKNFIVIEGK